MLLSSHTRAGREHPDDDESSRRDRRHRGARRRSHSLRAARNGGPDVHHGYDGRKPLGRHERRPLLEDVFAGRLLGRGSLPGLAGAYAAAQGGDTIYVKAGSYGSETIDARSLGTTVVTIAREPGGAAVTFAGITSRASYVTFDGLDVAPDPGLFSVDCTNCTYPSIGETSHVTIQNFRTPSLHVRAQYVTVRRGRSGPTTLATAGPRTGSSSPASATWVGRSLLRIT